MLVKKITIIFLFAAVLFPGASVYGQANNGGFQTLPYEIQETAPGMILVEGGLLENKKDTLKPFYISATEETNGQYLAYLHWIKNCYSAATYNQLLPDTTVWLRENITDSLKTFLVANYLRSAAFKDYPVVGVSPEQVLKYAAWKTDRVNEMILIREGILDFMYDPTDSSNTFSIDAYLGGKWTGLVLNPIPSFDVNGGERQVRMEDGIFMPRFRMVTENEWKYAALAIGDQKHKYIITPKEISNKKFDKRDYYGYLFLKRKVAKNGQALLWSNGIDLRPVYNTGANNYFIDGLYENVSEWVLDSGGRYVAAGGSWKASLPYYAAIYTPGAGDKCYEYPCPFPAFTGSTPSAAIGFRLAMDYLGTLDPRLKRRKVK